MNQHIFIRNGALAIIINIYKKFIGSIRFKSFIIFILVGIVPVVILASLLISYFANYYETELKTEMLRKANIIAKNLVITGYFGEKKDETYISTINAIVDGRAMIIDANSMVIYDSNDIEKGKFYVIEGIIDALKGESKYVFSRDENLGKVFVPIVETENKTVLGVVAITTSYEKVATSISTFRKIAMLLIVAFLIIILPLCYVFSGILTKPFRLFIKYIKDVTEGHSVEKIVVKGNNEIEEISESFNLMVQRFSEVEQNRQQFVADVSHELKTPLSSMKVLAESLLAQKDASKELYIEFLEDINSEVDRENKIINDLLNLVTLDKRENELNISQVNMNELVEFALKRLKPLAGKKNIQMIFESYRSVVAEIDETKMLLAVTNLVENAIKYNKDFGLITAILNADHKEFELIIKDTGIGIPEDSIDKIFERFYRIDKTRSRDTGGTGLGLSIVSKTIFMHNGTIKCESVFEKGTKFIVRVPLKYIT